MARTSVLTGGANNAQTTSEDLNGLATDFVTSGVVGVLTNTAGVAPMTGGLAGNAQGSPDRTAAVTAGIAYVLVTPTSQGSQRVRVKIDAQNVTHATNTTGSTRYDWVYVKVDATLAATPISDMSTTGTLVVSRSTSITVDNGTPPTYGYCIYKATLANSWTTLTNALITDVRLRAASTTTPDSLATGAAYGHADASETTTSTSYVQLSTKTDTVTVLVGANGLAFIQFGADIANSVAAGTSSIAVATTGATTETAGTNGNRQSTFKASDNGFGNVCGGYLATGLTPGITTFTLWYKVSANTGTFQNRHISVIPL